VKLLLLTPPIVQLNTPYPATSYLTGFLRGRSYDVAQADAGLEWALRLFSRAGLRRVLAALKAAPAHPAVDHLRRHAATIQAVVEPALALLQGRDLGLVHRIAARALLPEGPRFAQLGPAGHEEAYLDWAFGQLGLVDRARYFATLFLEDLADAVHAGIDPDFGLARYGEAMAESPPSFEPLLAALARSPLTAELLHEVTLDLLARYRPDVVGMSLPFPGTLLGALRMAKTLRAVAPHVRIVWGGGFVNTELRSLAEPRLFDYVDAVVYDDGERPLECLLEHYGGRRAASDLLRTRVREAGAVVWRSAAAEVDVPFAATGTPTYRDLPLASYLALIDMLNPMQRVWGDTRWNKLTVAHGCYWRKCSFCDTTLDYIKRFEAAPTSVLVDRIEALVAETGCRGFHFVDEAAAPAALKAMAEEIVRRELVIAWWGNIRFEKAFTPALCRLLARSGCIAVSGGLEAASDRLLALMNKGVTVAQVARVTRAFADAGIRVHAYLMYGFASETTQETIDSLEYVRQLFVAGCLDSAFWHRFSATAHSPVGQAPDDFGIALVPERVAPTFARNDLAFVDSVTCDHERLGEGLHKALYNYMLGLGLEQDVRAWFAGRVPKTRVPRRFVADALG